MKNELKVGVICMKRSELRKTKKKRKWWILGPLIGIGVLVLIVGVWATLIYNDAKKTVNEKMHQPIDVIDRDVSKKKVKAKEKLNILMLGIDAETGDAGRSDSIIVMTLRPDTDSMQLISIPRDTRTLIVGKGIEDKINHAYAFGGEEMAIATVENFLGIDIDYHVRMNMSGLKELIDELGGVTVTNDVEWQDGGHQFHTGPVDLDGEKALAYVRMRKKDPSGDFGRAKRQRQVVESIIKKGANVASIGSINNTIDILGNNMATSLDFDDMKRMLTGYMTTRHNIDSYQIQGEGTMLNGIYYYVVPEEEVQHVHNMIVN